MVEAGEGLGMYCVRWGEVPQPPPLPASGPLFRRPSCPPLLLLLDQLEDETL